MYVSVKYAHILFVSISILLFEYRFILKILKKPTVKILKVVPHINDTLLLVSGVTLAVSAGINPMVHSWLAAKIIALIFYIVFGSIALKASGKKSIYAYLVATALFVFIVLTAIRKTPLFINF